MNLKDNPGDLIKRSGPNIDEAKVIEQMVKEEGAKPEDLFRRFPDIARAALRRWHVSLTEGPEAALKIPDDELGQVTSTALVEEAKAAAAKTVADANAEAKRILDAAKAEAEKVLAAAKSGKKSDPLA